MQVVCANCQLSFEAPDGATGLVCPICRNPLKSEAQGGDGKAEAAAKTGIDWNGGTLDDLIALVTAPAVSARVEVFPQGSETPAGEVHLLAGGVSDALFGGQATDDALDKLRALTGARFRVEQRLPNPADGDMSRPGPESGTLDGRPLAHLMRYCEAYVITCEIEVWRGSESARVEYRRGEISGVTVGGIDAPERLAEVMQWASGNYRLAVPILSLPAVAPKRPQAATAAPAPVPAPAPSAQAARQASAGGASRTIFGMPPVDVAAARAAADAARAAQAHAAAPAPAPPPASATQTIIGPAPLPAAPAVPPGVAPSAVPAPVAAAAAARASATKTIFGVPAPQVPTPARPAPAAPPVEAVAQTIAAPPPAAAPLPKVDADQRDARKTGARKTAVPGPEISPPGGAPAPAPERAPAPSRAPAPQPPAAMAASAAGADAGRATHQGYDSARAPRPVSDRRGGDSAEKTEPTRTPSPRARETPIWTYVGVGFTFGLALLGIYQLVGRLAH